MKCDTLKAIRPGFILSVMAVVLCYSIGMPAMASAGDPGLAKGPQTVWSDQGMAGAVTGRVSTPDGAGIGGAYIALVDAANVGNVYYSTVSDAYGNYQITGVNATYSSTLGEGPNGQTGPDYVLGMNMYKIYAISPNGEGYSAAFGIDTNQSGATVTAVVIYQPDPSPGGIGLATVWSDQGKVGAVTGRVTTSVSGTIGIGGAYIALVDARDVSKEYYNTTSDAYGNYQITGVNATYSSTLGEGPDGTAGTYTAGQSAYKILAKKAPYGEGYSAAFGIDTNQSGATATAVVIFMKPASVTATAEKNTLKANGHDHTTISAYVTDALGNPVADGYPMKFHLGTDKKGTGQFAEAGSDVPAGTADIIVPTQNGYANVEFGWMTKARKSATITASLDGDPLVKGTVTIRSLHK